MRLFYDMIDACVCVFEAINGYVFLSSLLFSEPLSIGVGHITNDENFCSPFIVVLTKKIVKEKFFQIHLELKIETTKNP